MHAENERANSWTLMEKVYNNDIDTIFRCDYKL